MTNAIPVPVTKLIDAFSRLPGIGPKSASRLTYFRGASKKQMPITKNKTQSYGNYGY